MDKIFVSHYIREVEIGAFQSERGCTQRVEFNVCLDLQTFIRELDSDWDSDSVLSLGSYPSSRPSTSK